MDWINGYEKIINKSRKMIEPKDLKSGILEKAMQEILIEDIYKGYIFEITFPFYPYFDDALQIYIEFQENGLKLFDWGETLGQAFVNYGMQISDLDQKEKDYISIICDLHEIEREKGDVFFKILGQNLDIDDIFKEMMGFLQALLQISAVETIWKLREDF